VQHQRFHGEYLPSDRFHQNRIVAITFFIERIAQMSTGDNAQRSVGFVCIIDVQTQRHHVPQHIERRLHMVPAVLDRPRAKAVHLSA